MDHKSFETNMIDVVNRNAKSAEDSRNEKAREKQEAVDQRRAHQIARAIAEYICWVGFLIGILTLAVTQLIAFIPASILILLCSLFVFIAGVRINTLSIRISGHGGK